MSSKIYRFRKYARSISTPQAREINNNNKRTILPLRNVSRKECGTTVYCVGTDPLISFLFSGILWLSSPDLTTAICL